VSPGSIGYAGRAVQFWLHPVHGTLALALLTGLVFIAFLYRRRRTGGSHPYIRLVRAEDRPRLLRLFARYMLPRRAAPKPPVLRVIRGRQPQDPAPQQQLM
jgi:hypothetical protein